MNEQLRRKIELFKIWFQQKEYVIIKQGYSINVLSDTEQWFGMELTIRNKAFVIDINLPDFAPYYSISMEIYDLEKEDPLIMFWYDTAETDIAEFKQALENFFEKFITMRLCYLFENV